MSKGRAVLYLGVATHFWFACYYDWNYVKIPTTVHPMGITYGRTNKLKFLTYWNALLQSFFFTVAFLNEILGTKELIPSTKSSPLRRFKDLLLPCLAFPISMFVGLTFWGLYFIDRELVFPRAIDAFFPVWLNHVMHTNIMVFALIELFVSYRRYPSRSTGIGILTAFMASYLVWMHVIFSKTGIWVYPVMEKLDLASRIVFFAVLLGLSIFLYRLGETLNGRIWSRQIRSDESKSKKRT